MDKLSKLETILIQAAFCIIVLSSLAALVIIGEKVHRARMAVLDHAGNE